ncbi:ABC transporter permease/substrate-binding protein [Blastopirellula marina]|uniref:ABC transporter permease n=1 Tax=Blastopirellula marina TaxID=124 RepID=A0A2S8F4B3_9BACT|nr:ABC transporter permease/substrate-binding protein [Blastopirellula marina]PQO27002.1 ABC transporter permease [Blastopirellula marina]PTL41149.1 ABC transporter permease [Blastopirellula marina]
MFDTDFWARVPHQLSFLPDRLWGHVFLAFSSILAGVLISIPIGIFCSRRPKIEKVAVTIANIIQTIPGMALLAIMVFALNRTGMIPAWIALVLYSILPILRNTIAGMKTVDAGCLEAADGIGLNKWQRLRIVELPLAAPTILAGVRTASAWVVGAATLAYPVGATSLGDYIFAGLQTSNPVALMVGCFFSAGLALLLDMILGGLEMASQKRSLTWALGSVGCLVAVAISPLLMKVMQQQQTRSISNEAIATTEFVQERPYVIGGKPFTEQYILIDYLQGVLAEENRETEVKAGLGSTVVLDSLERGEIDCYVDYTGTLWAIEMERSDNVSSAEMMIDIGTYLKDKSGVLALGPLGFRNDYVFAMRKGQADELDIQSIDDLVPHAGKLTAACEIEFWSRPEWAAVQSKYGLQFGQTKSMDANLMYGALSRGDADVIVAYRTDGRLASGEFVELEDPRFALPPYDAVLLVSPRLAKDRAATEKLRNLVNTISTEKMRKANGTVDIDKKPIPTAVEVLSEPTS